jgi:hypothetical protein
MPACECVVRIDSTEGSGTGGGRLALVHGRELAIARITEMAALEAIASRDGRRERSDDGEDQNGAERGYQRTVHQNLLSEVLDYFPTMHAYGALDIG